MSLGAPGVGFVVDRQGPTWAFVVAGAVGALAAVTAMLVLRSAGSGRADEVEAQPAEAVPALP